MKLSFAKSTTEIGVMVKACALVALPLAALSAVMLIIIESKKGRGK